MKLGGLPESRQAHRIHAARNARRRQHVCRGRIDAETVVDGEWEGGYWLSATWGLQGGVGWNHVMQSCGGGDAPMHAMASGRRGEWRKRRANSFINPDSCWLILGEGSSSVWYKYLVVSA